MTHELRGCNIAEGTDGTPGRRQPYDGLEIQHIRQSIARMSQGNQPTMPPLLSARTLGGGDSTLVVT